MEIITVKNKKLKVTYTGCELYLKTLVEFSSKKIGKIDPKDKKFVEFYKYLFFDHLMGLLRREVPIPMFLDIEIRSLID